jgi:hypothetical protein
LKGGAEITLAPIPEDPSYKFSFAVQINEDRSPTIDIINGTPFLLKFVRPWLDGDPVAITDNIIASDNDNVYIMNLVVDVMGSPQTFVARISYSIIRRPLDGHRS